MLELSWLTLIATLTQCACSLKVDGFTEITALAGGLAKLPCNTSEWTSDVSLIIWYKGLTGKPLSSLDAQLSASSLASSASQSLGPRSLMPPSNTLGSERGESQIDRNSPSFTEKYYFDTSSRPPLFVIDSVSEEDSGDYRCRIDYRIARTRNYVVRVNVIVAPKDMTIFDAKEQPIVETIGPLEEGSDLELVCQAYGKPAPSVTWRLPDDILLDDSYLIATNGFVRNQLLLKSINRSMLMKEITCRASNTNYTHAAEKSVLIDMNLRPTEVALIGADKPISAGRQVAFECRSSGSRPPPTISWSLDGLKVNPLSETVNVDGNLTVNRAIFAFKPNENGKFFSCRSENPNIEGSKIDDGVVLTIHYLPSLTLTYGANIKPDKMREGFDVYLDCHINANPWVYETFWMLEGKPLMSDPIKRIIIANQSLVLQNVGQASRGSYQCAARNKEGQGISNRLFLRIQFVPTCKTVKTHPIAIALNEKARVQCEVDSDPENITFRWYLNNSSDIVQVSSFTSNTTQSQITYSPKSRFGYGTLMCLAENSVGKQKEPCVFRIVPAGPPQPVINCVLSNNSMTSILVDCEPGDDGGLPQSFVLEVYKTNSHNRLYNLSSTDRPVFMLNRLPPGTSLRFIIYSVNGKGKSSFTSLVGATLGPPERRTSATSVKKESNKFNWVLWLVMLIFGIIVGCMVVGIGVKLAEKHRRSNRSQRNIAEDEKSKDLNKGLEGRLFPKPPLDMENSIMDGSEKKCRLICTANDDGFVSVWTSNEDKPSPRIFSAYKHGIACSGYPTSTSVLLKTTIHDLNSEHEMDNSVDFANSLCFTGVDSVVRYASDAGVSLPTRDKQHLQNFDEMIIRESTAISTDHDPNCDAIEYSFTAIYPYNNRESSKSKDISI